MRELTLSEVLAVSGACFRLPSLEPIEIDPPVVWFPDILLDREPK